MLPILQEAFKNGSSDAANRLLCEYKDQIPVTEYPRILTLANEKGQLQSIQTLLSWGAKLESKHAQSIIVKLKKSPKTPPAKETQAMSKLVEFFIRNNLSFPFDTCLLTPGNVEIKTQILTHFLENCDRASWELLENTILTLKFSNICMTLIKLCFSNKYHYRLTHPEKFTDFAAATVRYRNPIIKGLIEKGVNLNQKIRKFDGVAIPEFENRIEHLVAFYPSHTSLLKKLLSADANLFGRTAAHYVALAIPSFLNKPKAKTHKVARINNVYTLVNNGAHSKKNQSSAIPNRGIQEFEKDFHWCEFFFRTDNTGSFEAFQAIHSKHWHTPDIADFSPLEYAAMHAHGENGQRILEHNNKLLSEELNKVFTSSVRGGMYILPLVLSEIIKEYLTTYKRPDEAAIDWAKQMIAREKLFEEKLQKIIIKPLKKYCNDDYQTAYYEQALQGIRIAQQLFTFITLWDFESFRVKPIYRREFPPHTNEGYGVTKGWNFIDFFSNRSEPSDYIFPFPELGMNPILEEEKADNASSSNHFSFFSTPVETSYQELPVSLKSRKRRLSGSDDVPQISWKQRRETLIESLEEVYQSGSRPKHTLKNELEPYITKLMEARNEQAMEQAVTKMKEAYSKSEYQLKNTLEQYGLTSWLENILNIKNSAANPTP